jgi:L-fuconolactonase
MSDRADSHAHLFKPGWAGELSDACRHVQPDEVTLYESLASRHRVKHMLAVGYTAEEWCRDNNEYLTQITAERPFIKPLAYVTSVAGLTIRTLERFASHKFAGIALYIFDVKVSDALLTVPSEVWQWLIERRWLISVNSKGEQWNAWRAVLDRAGQLRLLVSHLGLPPAAAAPPDSETARDAMKSVLNLAQYPQVRVKLSGFYALTNPRHDYPHRAAWPYVMSLCDIFGTDRLLWGSDFYPAMEYVSFPQTYGLFADMPFLSAADREKIEGRNLIKLLSEVQ